MIYKITTHNREIHFHTGDNPGAAVQSHVEKASTEAQEIVSCEPSTVTQMEIMRDEANVWVWFFYRKGKVWTK